MDIRRLDIVWHNGTANTDGRHVHPDGQLDAKELQRSVPKVLFSELTRNLSSLPAQRLNFALGIDEEMIDTMGLATYAVKLGEVTEQLSALLEAKTFKASEEKLKAMYEKSRVKIKCPEALAYDLAVVVLYEGLNK